MYWCDLLWSTLLCTMPEEQTGESLENLKSTINNTLEKNSLVNQFELRQLH